MMGGGHGVGNTSISRKMTYSGPLEDLSELMTEDYVLQDYVPPGSRHVDEAEQDVCLCSLFHITVSAIILTPRTLKPDFPR